jgi:hypothetical protein
MGRRERHTAFWWEELKQINNLKKWADNINVDLKQTTLGGMDWIKLAQIEDRWWAPMNSVKNL